MTERESTSNQVKERSHSKERKTTAESLPETTPIQNTSNRDNENVPLRKRVRNAIVEWNMKLWRSSKMPDALSGFVLRSLHFHTPGYFLLLFFLLSRKHALFATIPLLCAFVMFLLLNGCYITIVEYKLTKEDINIIDPYIYLCGDTPNSKNRFHYTFRVALAYMTFVGILLSIRFYFRL